MLRLLGVLLVLTVATFPEGVAAPPASVSALPKGAVVVQGSRLLMAITPGGKRAYAFSNRTGEIGAVPVDPPGGAGLQPVLGDSVGCFIAGTKAYAYGAESGAWAVVDLGAVAQPVVSTDLVRIDVAPRIFLFSSTSKAWQVIDLSKDED
jgi:hypothetical protein